MTKLAIAKTAAKTVVGFSAAYIVHSIVKNNTNAENPIDQMKVVVGGFVLGAMVADVAARYTEAQIDSIVASVKEARQ